MDAALHGSLSGASRKLGQHKTGYVPLRNEAPILIARVGAFRWLSVRPDDNGFAVLRDESRCVG